MSAPLLFTIAEIARALGCSRQNVHGQLSGIPADGEKFEKFVAGKIAKAWRPGSLPTALLEKALAIRKFKAHATLEHVFSSPAERFELRDSEGRSLLL